MYNFSFFGQYFFWKHFYSITGFCNKTFNLCKFAKFIADSKSKAQELSNDVSFVIIGHQTWDLEGGVKLTPPQHILVFKYPSRDRVKSETKVLSFCHTFSNPFIFATLWCKHVIF